MSKEHTTNGILEETSPKSQPNESATDTTQIESKSLEELESEKLQAISQGEIPETAINYSDYVNKPNKVVETSEPSTDLESISNSNGVRKINSRPDNRELRKRRRRKRPPNGDSQHRPLSVNQDKPVKIDTKSGKAKAEALDVSTTDELEEKLDLSDKFRVVKERRLEKKVEFPQENQGASTGPIDISEKFNLAKARRTQKIDELNSNLTKVTSRPAKEQPTDTPKVEITQNIVKKDAKPKDGKKSLKSRIENYFFIVEDTKEPLKDKDTGKDKKVKLNPFRKKGGQPAKPTVEKTSTELTKPSKEVDKSVNVVKVKEKLSFLSKKGKPKEGKDTPKENVKVKKDFEFIPFVKSLFLGDDYVKPKKDAPKETFKQRMVDFFYPLEEDTPKEVTQVAEEPVTVVEDTPKEVTQVAEEPVTVIEDTPKEVTQVAEEPVTVVEDTPEEVTQVAEEPVTIIEDTPEEVTQVAEEPVTIIEDTPKEVTQVAEEPVTIIEDTPEEVTQVAEEPVTIIEDTPKEVTQVAEEHVAKKLSVYRRVKNFFLSEELQYKDEDTLIVEKVPEVLSEEEMAGNVMEDTPDDSEDDENLILPFNKDTPSEAIDIPIDEPPRYKHFWQDPNFSIVDRVKTYRQNYKNRKRSGDFHVEIKSTPDTAILFEDFERKLIAHEKLIKSREEYQKQVANGEYDGFEESPTRKVDEEPTFYKNSVADFNSYDDTQTVKDYVADMKNGLMFKMTITVLTTLISSYITIANDLELPLPDTLNVTISASGYLLAQCILGLITILTSIKTIFSGIVKVFKGRSDCDSLASIGVVFAFISTILTYLFGQSIVEDKVLNVYMCVGIIGMLCNLWGKNLILSREEHNFRYISKDKEKFGLYCIQDDDSAEDITKGLVDDCPVTTYNRKAKFTRDFVKYTYSRDMADKFSQVAVPLIVGVSLLVSVIAGIVYNRTFEMQVPVAITSILSMLVSFCSCFSVSIGINSTLNSVSEKYPRREGALLGYQAVEDFYDVNSIVLSANDVFPKDSIKLCGMKLFANGKLDETLIYAISLANKCNSILASTLMKIVENRTDYLTDVESYSYEDYQGICGWIDSKRILMGNRELMEAHNVENLPSKSKELELTGSNRDAVYVSISGNLALMLIVEVTPVREVKRYLQTLEDSNISIAVTSADFLVSVSRISYLYDIDEESIKVIPHSVYEKNREYFKDRSECSSSIVTGGNINVLTDLLVITKKVHRSALIGNILYAVACILGILIAISFITMGAFKELNPTMVLFYNGVCTLITIILTKLKV